MNQKIEKLKTERAKNVEKIAGFQTRNKEIDGLIVELENTDIIGLVREAGLSPDMLVELIQAMKQKPAVTIHSRDDEMEDIDEN